MPFVQQIRSIFFTFVASGLCAMLPAHAGVLDNTNQSTVSSSTASPINASALSAPADFLPVHQAYQLDVEIQETQLLLHWRIAKDYFLYGEQFHVALTQNDQPLAIELQKETGEIAYVEYFEREVERFHHNTTLTIKLPATLHANKNIVLGARFQGCAEAGLCYPPETLHYRLDIAQRIATPVTENTTPPAQILHQAKSSFDESSFVVMFIFALLGGLILNLMPCVFPVLSIKLLSFTRSNESTQHLKMHSAVYTLGVLSTFLLTALILILLRQSGALIGWGFQLQSPAFISFLIVLFLVLGLSLSGFINMGTRWMGVGQQLTSGDHYRSSFFTGVLAVIVASPCSVPFMGVALGYALTQPPLAALIIFMGLGLGLASPFILFAYVPWLIQHIPKPGPWMERLKHWLALPLYLSALWLMWVLWNQLTWQPLANTEQTKPAGQYWESYSATKLSNYLDNHEAVFIELTADWCITCLVNEKVALNRSTVINTMKEKNIHYLRGDWTHGDAEITVLLQQHQRGGVPLYLYYRADGAVTILPQLLTEQIVLNALNSQ